MTDRLVDLTYSLGKTASRYPTDPEPEIRVIQAQIDADRLKSGYSEFRIRSHHGTHIDAPAHKIPGGKTIDQYEISKFINQARLINLTPYLRSDEDYVRRISQELLEHALTPKCLHRMKQERISVLVFRTGYDNTIERGVTEDFNFPYFKDAAAEFLVKRCEQEDIQLDIVGIDSFTVDPKGTPDSPAHSTFLSRDILILETLVRLNEVAQTFGDEPFELICPPIIYEGADAAQTRAFACPVEKGERP
jgi:arylformamidase